MTFEQMLSHGPVHVHRRETGDYHAVWSPVGPDGSTRINGVGTAATPYMALSNARTDAKAQGWIG